MLELKNVNVTLAGDDGQVKKVLKEINLTIEQKKIYVMTGPNGGGKSSIAKTIMGIFQPSSGQILLDGMDITHKSIDERARLGIGYAFQQPPRFKGLKVRDVLGLASGSGDKIKQCDLLFSVGLCSQDYLDREMNASLSGGEMKRIEIAGILAKDLKVAVFDEPEAGIDLWSFQKLTETFENMHLRYNTGILIISHQERILKLADQVILIADGSISEITSPDKLFADIRRIDSECECRNECTIGGKANAECNR